MREFSFRYDRWCGWLLGLLGSGRRFSRVVVTSDDVLVALGPGFRSVLPRASIRSIKRWQGPVLGWGAHGWRGKWLVNGSSKGIIVLEVEPHGRGWVLGFPVRIRELAISLEDPEGFVSELGMALSPI